MPNKDVVIIPLEKITEYIDESIPISLTVSLTKLSLIEKDNWPAIINKIPIIPVENNILLFTVNKNNYKICYKPISQVIYMDLLT